MLTIQVIIGTTRQGRFSEKIAAWLMPQLKKEGVAVELIDLRDYPLPFYEEATSPKMLKGNFQSPVAVAWHQKISQADGFIFLVAEYNHGYTAVLKNALDYLYEPLVNKPVAFVSYGGAAAGTRAVQQLRQVIVELHMHSVHDEVNIAGGRFAFNEDGTIKDQKLQDKVMPMFNQLIDWTKLLKDFREKTA